jgi:putative ABC transport system permease protein
VTQLAPPPARPAPAGSPAAAPWSGRVSGWLVRWRLALRLARRDARRAKGRTALVAVMVGLPVLAIVGADTLYATNEVSAVEALPARLGSADVSIEGLSREPVRVDPVQGSVFEYPEAADPPWTLDEVRGHLPAGAEVVERQVGQVAYRTGAGYATVQGFADDLTDPIRAGAFHLVEGRVPVRDGEVAVSRGLTDRGIGVGDRLELTRDDVTATVVGVIRSDAGDPAPYLVLAPGQDRLLTSASTEFFAAVPGGLDWPAVQELNRLGLVVLSREVVQDPPPEAEYLPAGYRIGADPAALAVIALVVASLLLEVVLLAGPAFAVGLRRRRRDLALLAASGGTPADLRRAVLASGLLLGAGAAVVGALLGVALARVAIPILESGWDASFGPFEVPVLHAVAVVVAGGLAGLAAAAVPARQAARTDVVTALTGRRATVRRSWRLPVLGFVVAAAGLGLTVLGAQGTELAVAGGAVLLVLGLVVATPWLVGLLAPLARRLPTAGRLAVRDATRNRSRTAPAVAAVMATVAGVTALAIGSASDSAQGRRDYVPTAPMGAATVSMFAGDTASWDAAERAMEQRVPGRPVRRIQAAAAAGTDPVSLWVAAPGCTGTQGECMWFPEGMNPYNPILGDVVVLDADTLAATTAPEVRAAALAAHRAGRMLVFGRGARDAAGAVTLQATRYDATAERAMGSVTLPATEIGASGGGPLPVPATVVVPPALVDRLPTPVATTALLVGGPDAPVTEAEEAALREAITAITPDSSVHVERGWWDPLWVARLLLVVVGGVLVLVATLTATGLAMADARPDLATLAAVGAAPSTRRRMAMAAAAVIGGTGALLGLLVGLAPGIAVAYPLTSNDYGNGAHPLVVVPWEILGAVGVAVPLLAVVVTGFAVRSRLPMATRIRG